MTTPCRECSACAKIGPLIPTNDAVVGRGASGFAVVRGSTHTTPPSMPVVLTGPAFPASAAFDVDGTVYRVVREPDQESLQGHARADWQAFQRHRVGSMVIGGARHAIIADAPPDEHHESRRDPAEILTPRELQILGLVAAGRANKEIAQRLHISGWTVSTHLRRIFAKLAVDSRAAAVYQCAELVEQVRTRGSQDK